MERPVFYFDLGSPYAYLVAERINGLLPVQPRWQPILLGAVFKATGRRSWAEGDERSKGMAGVERRAKERNLMPLKWPQPWPGNTLKAMRLATYCNQVGKGEAFAQAAFRQAFAGGRDLGKIDNLLIAAAACEVTPRAALNAIEQQNIKDALRAATDEALGYGVTGVPTVRIGMALYWGDDRLEQAAAALL